MGINTTERVSTVIQSPLSAAIRLRQQNVMFPLTKQTKQKNCIWENIGICMFYSDRWHQVYVLLILQGWSGKSSG